MKSLIRKLFPNKLAIRLRRLKNRFDVGLINWCSKSYFLSTVYYLIINRSFYREHKSVLAGRAAYRASLARVEKSSYLLRRNIHRLEKGLIMRPRRQIFALDYIEQTVECYTVASFSESFCSSEAKWASDVLSEYFSVVEKTPFILRLKDSYIESKEKIFDRFCVEFSSFSGQVYTPYSSLMLPDLQVNTDDLESLYMRRRSTRWFEPRQVPIDSLMKLVDMASTAPSACNRQPYQFQVCSTSEKARAVAKLAMGTSGFVDNLQALIIVIGDLSAYPLERDRHCIYIDASLASMQLMLAAETFGLSTCPINWPDIDNREVAMKKMLGLPDYMRPVMLIAIGYADKTGNIAYSQKKKNKIIADIIDN